MQMTSKRVQKPTLSETRERVLAQYEQQLRIEEDLAHAPIRNYLSDLRHFATLYIRGTKQDLQQDVEKIAWI